MKTRQVFRMLRNQIEPPLNAMGYSPFKDGSAGDILIWTRPWARRKYETVSCQIDKWPWDPWIGSKFRVSMNRSRYKGNLSMCRESAMMYDLLSAKEKREVQVRQNKVIAKRRIPEEAEYNAFMCFPAYDEYEIASYREASKPVDYSCAKHVDLWLNIIDENDVTGWAEYLSEWLPHALTRSADVDWSKFGW